MPTEDKKDEVVQESVDEAQDTEALELVLLQVSKCYVYMIPPRKSAASYRERAEAYDFQAALHDHMKYLN
ncbi:hypothetical protein K1719_031364 [Acacia pycnantha]|nr:hypothetical protein K1719_031364 [Acacia pycnantha]